MSADVVDADAMGSSPYVGHQCSWDPENEASRPFTKQYVESLRVKIQLLESQIAQLQASSSTPTASSSTPTVSYPPELPSPSSFSQETLDEPLGSPYAPNPALHASVSLPLSTPSGHEASPPVPSHSSAFQIFAPATIFQYQYIFNIDPSGHHTPETQASLYCRWDLHLPDLGQAKLTRVDHDEMISRYFSNGMSWLSGLVPVLFLSDMLSSLGQHVTHPATDLTNYTPLLHCSLLALASGVSENPYIRTHDTRTKFAAQAKDWLYDQFGDFHPTLLPALSLLAEYHKGMGEINTGMGIRATRASTTVITVSTHAWYCWLVYAQEALFALETGRPNEMVTPKASINYNSENWEDHSSIVAEVFVQSCKLSVIATEVSGNRRSDESSVTSLQLKLDSWFNSLPDRLLIRQRAASTHSHVFCLHICYWWITLRLYIPLYKEDKPKDSGGGSSWDRPSKMCNRATEKLVQLFSEFEKQYTLKYFPGNLLHAIVLCGEALLLERAQVPDGAPRRRAKAQEGIDSCVRTLRLTGETWHRAVNLADELQARAA